jgi:hypothetical protein
VDGATPLVSGGLAGTCGERHRPSADSIRIRLLCSGASTDDMLTNRSGADVTKEAAN